MRYGMEIKKDFGVYDHSHGEGIDVLIFLKLQASLYL